MPQQLIATPTRAAAFDTVAQADRAIRWLLASGLTKDQVLVICPTEFKNHFLHEIPQTDAPSPDASSVMAMGSAAGATIGGLALAATAVTGGAAGTMAAVVLVGGGAIAGGFCNLIVAKGYEQEADELYRHAVERGQIVVAVEARDETADQLGETEFILEEAGGQAVAD